MFRTARRAQSNHKSHTDSRRLTARYEDDEHARAPLRGNPASTCNAGRYLFEGKGGGRERTKKEAERRIMLEIINPVNDVNPGAVLM